MQDLKPLNVSRWCPAFVTQVGPDGSELLIRGNVIEWHLRSPFTNSPFIGGARKSISIDLGDGADRAELHFEGAHLNATVYNVLDINIKAGRHEDEVNAYFGSIAGALFQCRHGNA